MRVIVLFCVTLLFASAIPDRTIAQEAAAEATPYWYVNYFTVDWNRTDSLTKLWELTAPVRELRKKNGELLEWVGLLHDTGNELNVVEMRKYPSWSAIKAETNAFETVFPDEAERDRINEGFDWVFGAAAHQDVIYSESPGSIMPSLEDTTGGAYWYASFYEIPWSRMDSLNALWEQTVDVPAEALKKGSILGAIGLVHHTGVHRANVVSLTKFPSWDAMETQNWADAAMEAVVPDSSLRAQLNEGFNYVFQDEDDGFVPHYDVIYTQPIR